MTAPPPTHPLRALYDLLLHDPNRPDGQALRAVADAFLALRADMAEPFAVLVAVVGVTPRGAVQTVASDFVYAGAERADAFDLLRRTMEKHCAEEQVRAAKAPKVAQ